MLTLSSGKSSSVWSFFAELSGSETEKNKASDGRTLANACKLGNVKLLNTLLAEKNTNPAEFNNSPLRLASEFGHEKVVEILLYDRRVDPSALDNQVNFFILLWLSKSLTDRPYVLLVRMVILE